MMKFNLQVFAGILGLAILFGGSLMAQSVGINTDTPDPSALMELSSTNKGFLPPLMTEAQRDDIVSPAEGLIIFNTTTKTIDFYADGEWQSLQAIPPPGFTCGDNVTFTYNGQEVTYGSVQSAGGRCWLDRNLGASQVATVYSDHLAHGDLFQWGRDADGHQLITWTNNTTGTLVNSTTTNTLSTGDTPGHSNFINAASDWRSPPNDALWQGVSGANNPCPTGWRLPTSAEWDTEKSNWSTGAFNSPLKITLPGCLYGDAQWFQAGQTGYYWSSTISGTNASYLVETGSASIATQTRIHAMSVRCIKD